MGNASHRHVKAVKAPRIPWGHALAIVVFIGALFAGIVLAASLSAPPASAAYVTPAVVAAKTVELNHVSASDSITQWQRVKAHCRKVGCTHPSAAILRDLGYGPHHKALMHVGDTTFIWVRLPHGRVRTFTS